MASQIKELALKARMRRERKFLSDIPCKHGHIGERYASSGECVICSLRKPRSKKRESAPQVKWWEFLEKALPATRVEPMEL